MLTKHNKKKRQVESTAVEGGISVRLVVGLDGYDYKHYTRDHKYSPTTEYNVHMSLNGPLQMTFAEAEALLENLKAEIAYAKKVLEEEAGN